MRNPQEQSHPPDEPIERFTITATLHRHTSVLRNDTWYVTCPEWNYRNETNEPIDMHIHRLVTEIKNHNSQ